MNFAKNAEFGKYFKCELDEIVKNAKTDNFFTLYKIFNVISHKNKNPIKIQEMKVIEGEVGQEGLIRRRSLQKMFWTQLLNRSKNKTNLFLNHAPRHDKDCNMGAGKTGLLYQYIIISEAARVELWITRKDAVWNKSTFDYFYNYKNEIEESFGERLSWDRVDDKQASYIKYWLYGSGLNDTDKWPELHDQMIEAMIKFEKTFRPYIQELT